jgi:hypothetical protein
VWSDKENEIYSQILQDKLLLTSDHVKLVVIAYNIEGFLYASQSNEKGPESQKIRTYARFLQRKQSDGTSTSV